MRVGCPSTRQCLQRIIPSVFLSGVIVLLLLPQRKHEQLLQPAELEQHYPLLWTHVHMNNGTGGGGCTPSSACEHTGMVGRLLSLRRLYRPANPRPSSHEQSLINR